MNTLKDIKADAGDDSLRGNYERVLGRKRGRYSPSHHTSAGLLMIQTSACEVWSSAHRMQQRTFYVFRSVTATRVRTNCCVENRLNALDLSELVLYRRSLITLFVVSFGSLQVSLERQLRSPPSSPLETHPLALMW